MGGLPRSRHLAGSGGGLTMMTDLAALLAIALFVFGVSALLGGLA